MIFISFKKNTVLNMKMLNAREYNRGNIAINETHTEKLRHFCKKFFILPSLHFYLVQDSDTVYCDVTRNMQCSGLHISHFVIYLCFV